jgi:hypothetical protein
MLWLTPILVNSEMSADMTPTEFLELLTREYLCRRPPIHEAAAAYADVWYRQYAELARKYEPEWVHLPAGQSIADVDIAEMMTRPLLAYLKPSEAERLRCQVAVGVAMNPDINAFVARASHEPIYAIILHIGLLDFLNKSIKLIFAAQHPSAVTFSIDHVSSGRKPPSFEVEDVDELQIRLLRQYRSMSFASGCDIILMSPYTELAYTTSTLAVMFVLWHEYAHFLEGHLDSADFAPLSGVSGAYMLVSGGGHQKEYAADAFSFELIAKLLPDWRSDRVRLLLAVSWVFSALQFFHGDTATESHPAPRERLESLFRRYLSPEEQVLHHYVLDAF